MRMLQAVSNLNSLFPGPHHPTCHTPPSPSRWVVSDMWRYARDFLSGREAEEVYQAGLPGGNTIIEEEGEGVRDIWTDNTYERPTKEARIEVTRYPVVPYELVDYIIDHLHNDISSLENCALVCRSWLPSSRFHMFRRIEVDISNDYAIENTRYHRICQSLESSPDLGRYVEELVLTRQGGGWLVEGCEQAGFPACAFPNMRSFTLIFDQWKGVPSTFIGSVQNLLQSSPSLGQIHIEGGQFPTFSDILPFISSPLGLRHVKLSSVKFGNADVSYEDNNGQIQLETLYLAIPKIAFLSEWLANPRCSVGITCLRSLHILETMEFLEAGRLVEGASTSLEHLELRGPYPLNGIDDSVGAINLCNAPNLRSLRLSDVTRSETFSPVRWIRSLFSDITSSVPLESIEIEVSGGMHEGLDWLDWKDLDVLFSRSEFGELKKVVIVLHVDKKLGEPRKELKKLWDQMPNLRKQGIVEVISRDQWMGSPASIPAKCIRISEA